VKGFDVDFVRRPLPRWVAPVFFLVCLLALVVSLGRFSEQRELQSARAAEERKALEDAARPPPPSAEELKRQEQQAQERAALLYPWKGVFDALEAAGGPEVTVTSFSHDRRARKSHLVLEGPSFKSIDAALTRMKAASPAQVEWRVESVAREPSGATAVFRATVLGSW
jgi:hypothetical protein